MDDGAEKRDSPWLDQAGRRGFVSIGLRERAGSNVNQRWDAPTNLADSPTQIKWMMFVHPVMHNVYFHWNHPVYMVSLLRVFWVWGYFHLSIGVGLMAITHALFDPGVTTPLIVGSGGALLAAYVLVHQYPDCESSVFRRFGFLTIVLFIAGHIVVADGFQLPPGDSSPLMVGLLWMASMAVAYELSAGGRFEWVSDRLPSR